MSFESAFVLSSGSVFPGKLYQLVDGCLTFVSIFGSGLDFSNLESSFAILIEFDTTLTLVQIAKTEPCLRIIRLDFRS